MSFELDPAAHGRLVARPEALDPEVVRVEVDIRPDHYGEHALFFRVVLKNEFKLEPPSAKIGGRLQRISDGLRRRTVAEAVPMPLLRVRTRVRTRPT